MSRQRFAAILCGWILLLFHAGAAMAEPAIVCDDARGYWLYESASLRVEINRRSFSDPLVWYEADIITSPDAMLRGYLSADSKPQRHLKKPERIAQERALVFGMTDDFFAARIRSKKMKEGVIIRGGVVLYDEVYRGNGQPFPPLDAMALFPDGGMRVFSAREYKAADYLEMGATDVFSFGPLLLRDGVMDPRLEEDYMHLEPRAAVGVIAPHHYFCIVAEGRDDDSRGCGLVRVAQRMLEVGVTDAINMDGGQTAAMLFLGQQINAVGSYQGRRRVRSVSGLLGVSDPEWSGAQEQE